MRILVVGAGAIGSVVGAGLTEACEDVTLAETDAEHLEAIREGGLRMEGYPAERTVEVRAVSPAELDGTYDVVFLAVKSQHTSGALAPVRERLAADGCVVSLQNSVNAPTIASVVGSERVVSTVIHLAADQLGPGRVVRHGEGEFIAGSPLAAQLLGLVAPTTFSENILGWQWTKQIYGCFLVASALADEPNPEQLRDPCARAAHAALLTEATRAALASGIRLEAMDMFNPADFVATPDHAERALDVMAAHSGKGKSGMWRDIRVKGRHSESDYITGEVVQAAHAAGLPAPVNSAVLAMIHELEAGTRQPSMDNFRELLGG